MLCHQKFNDEIRCPNFELNMHVNKHCSIMQVEIIEHPSWHMGHAHAQRVNTQHPFIMKSKPLR